MDIVELINEIKTKYRVSVAEIARQIGVAPSTLTRHMTGERSGSPRMSTLQALIDLHGDVTPQDAAAMLKTASGYTLSRPGAPLLLADQTRQSAPQAPAPQAETIMLPLVRHVFGQEFDPSDPNDVLEHIPISRNIARPGSYAIEMSGSAPIGSASMYTPAGSKLVIDPSRPCRPGHPVMIRYMRDEGHGTRVDGRAVYLFVSYADEGDFYYTHAGSGTTELMEHFEFDDLVPIVAVLYN